MIKAIVVDDELPSLQKLGKLLGKSGHVQVTGAFTQPLEALAFLQTNGADAVFLDIEMPDMDGIELANRILDLRADIDIIFVTAYNQYAVEAFRLNALDYLLKPVAADRLEETLGRITQGGDSAIAGAEIAVRCFGKFEVTVGAQQIRFRTEKAEELLAYLIDGKGAFVSRSKILDSLWEEFDGDRAVVHFNTTLHYLKKALLPYGVPLSIQYDRGSYRLDTSNLNCDYLRFCSLVQGSDPIDRENVLASEEAAALYIQEYLCDREYGWAAGRRLQLQELFIGLVLEISQYHTKAGCHVQAAKWLRDGLLHEPLHRELNYRLVEILLLDHEWVLAEKHYDLYRNGLKKKMGLEPDAGFQKLLQQR